jgi:selT/selW/selH-like putative selenoprotein
MADSKPRIRIEYCVPCGAKPKPYATALVDRLFDEHEQDVAAIDIVMGSKGIFDVHVDDQLVLTKSMLGRYPDPDDVVPLIQAQLAA